MNAKTDDEIESALNGAIEGNALGEYLLMGNWNYAPVEPGKITCCIVAVSSAQPELSWKVHYSMKVWGTVISRVSPVCYVLGTGNGEIVRVTGESRETFQTDTVGAIHGIWIRNGLDCWFTHRDGLSLWQGGAVSKSVAGGRLYGIHGLQSDFAVAVGMVGKVMRFDGSNWREVDSVPTNKMLVAVHCISNKEIYIGGRSGSLFRWDGGDRWTKIKVIGDDHSIVEESIYTITQYLGDIYVGLGYYGLYRIAGNEARKVKGVYSSKANVVEGKLLVTGDDSFAEFDGTTWRTISVRLP
ncbi:hypothetical protein HF313_23080 [Massilia atriviolacea]|uniref:Glucosyl transferase n=1 Tax=Massilia atriviolacea TaxID=2495579 RepID=A0A430HKQ1_9BURK|nr:hypothetical protein [Massilia atriviolacea]RSZ58071.1 hypothetical protein EJB06_17410 [Massilia atriviolacea]